MNLHPKQKEDLARAALHDGLIFSWDTGCGKTLASFLWPLLKVGYTVSASAFIKPNQPVLIIGPTDGFDHFKAEGALLSIDLIPLDSQETFERLAKFDIRSRRTLPPAFYYTTFTQLTRNGVASFPDLERFASASSADCQSAESPTASRQSAEARQEFQARWKAAQTNLGEFRKIKGRSIHCIYSPTLADLIAGHFDCVVVDEGVHMKGASTQVGTGIRQLTPRFRLVLTATPIKNRLPDVFFLAAWAAGVDDEPNARWPYCNQPEEQTKFAETFLIAERNLTREAQAKAMGKRRCYQKLSAEVCNVHGLWKLFAPILLRRRKVDFAAGIPPKKCHILRVPMGKAQAEVYAYHLNARYLDKNRQPAHGAKLQALRVAAANPRSSLLTEQV